MRTSASPRRAAALAPAQRARASSPAPARAPSRSLLAGAARVGRLARCFDWGVLRRRRRARLRRLQGAREHGACWGFVAEKWRLILFGRYPYEQQWRPALATGAVLAMLVASALPALWTRRGARWLAAGWVVALRGSSSR